MEEKITVANGPNNIVMTDRHASGSVLARVLFTSIDDTSQPDAATIKTETDARAAESIDEETRLDGNFVFSQTNLHTRPELKISYDSSLAKDRSARSWTDHENTRARCSRYCVEHLESGDHFQDVSLLSSFVDQGDNFSIENRSDLRNSTILSISNDDETLINLDNCKIYFILDCNIVKKNTQPSIYSQEDEYYTNLETHTERENVTNSFVNITPEFSIKLAHSEANLSGRTETNLNVDTNVTRIVIRTFGNLTRIVLTVSATNGTTRQPEIPMSLTYMYTAKGVVIGARNLPPGRLCAKLTGVENSKYSIDVITYLGVNEEINKTKHDRNVDNEPEFNNTKEENADNERADNLGTKFAKLISERSVEITDSRINDDDVITNDSFEKDTLISSAESALININNPSILETKSLLSSYGDVKFLGGDTSNKMFNEELIDPKQLQTIQARSSEVASLNENIDTNIIDNTNLSKKVINKDRELSAQFAANDKELFEQLSERRNVIEVNSKSSLIATPGTTHRLVFDVTNNCFLPVRYAIRAKSAPFRIYNVLPTYLWLRPGQTSYVTVDMIVPLGTQNSINTLTLSIDETQISQKTVYVYVQDSFRDIDDAKPTIEYSFNSNCAGKLNKDRCDKTFWSADVVVQDSDSGLKRVLSTPNRIYPRTEFISGTKERITFYYSSSCCSTSAKITAIDVFDNQYIRTIDVTEWDNLSQGEIAAISVGALLLLLLLILLIIGIIYCVRRRSSHDLSYSQRYGGSRPRESRPERTSF
ncbi:uncharacterized protein LOC109854502 isoform X2 [Pseudomyrmex gracilis]|uniref:uncharacterized protein LOC109854502 isoform X2 n=1 Tax=Pseudomyrmex gracilis TaxID=219809 RepID=UPI000994B96F|nr:uncharacterized protein LOC109854502 isoform X2 [Pseudomyrmex gracilis]